MRYENGNLELRFVTLRYEKNSKKNDNLGSNRMTNRTTDSGSESRREISSPNQIATISYR